EFDLPHFQRRFTTYNHGVESNNNAEDVQTFRSQLSKMTFPFETRTSMHRMKDRHIVVVHDAPPGRIPWETLTIGDWSAAVDGGLSRRYLANNLPVAAWLEERRAHPSLKLLLIVNPLGVLSGAAQ